jgi:hypothetical protein
MQYLHNLTGNNLILYIHVYVTDFISCYKFQNIYFGIPKFPKDTIFQPKWNKILQIRDL